MKYSNKGAAPKIFIDWVKGEQETHGHLPPYENLQNPEKEAMRQSLIKEQGYLCVYCGRSLESDFSDSHIDHFWPQSIFNGKTHEDRRVCYSNLFMSCGRDSGLPITCGRAKGNWFNPSDYIIPSDPCCEGRFIYTGAGKIEPQNPCDTATMNMIKILNLNNLALKYARKQIIQYIARTFFSDDPATTPVTTDEIQDEIDALNAANADGRLTGFSQVSRRYIEEEMLLF